MNTKRKLILGAGVAVALAVGGVGVANAVGDDGDLHVTGPGAEKAKAAALDLIRGGTANAVERDGEKGATWEVEVARPDGSSVDVRLDDAFEKVAIDADSEGE